MLGLFTSSKVFLPHPKAFHLIRGLPLTPLGSMDPSPYSLGTKKEKKNDKSCMDMNSLGWILKVIKIEKIKVNQSINII